uniref:Uncharacterized protein n=1 Tax=Romanomermis culicivorax TaxID=13658 RepID=A0A915II26_ROMCU
MDFAVMSVIAKLTLTIESSASEIPLSNPRTDAIVSSIEVWYPKYESCHFDLKTIKDFNAIEKFKQKRISTSRSNMKLQLPTSFWIQLVALGAVMFILTMIGTISPSEDHFDSSDYLFGYSDYLGINNFWKSNGHDGPNIIKLLEPAGASINKQPPESHPHRIHKRKVLQQQGDENLH